VVGHRRGGGQRLTAQGGEACQRGAWRSGDWPGDGPEWFIAGGGVGWLKRKGKDRREVHLTQMVARQHDSPMTHAAWQSRDTQVVKSRSDWWMAMVMRKGGAEKISSLVDAIAEQIRATRGRYRSGAVNTVPLVETVSGGGGMPSARTKLRAQAQACVALGEIDWVGQINAALSCTDQLGWACYLLSFNPRIF
jgi:hypothetical protein